LNTALQQWLDETLAVLVLYKTPLNSADTFISLTASLKANDTSLDLFVYDNSPTATLAPFSNQNWKITYLHDCSNPGVSKAYNEGAKKANQLGKKWLLLLDQDTIFTENAITSYFRGVTEYPSENCFVPQLIDVNGIISPFKFRSGNGFRVKSVSKGVYSLNGLQFVNCGVIVRLDTFEVANGFNEKLKLDFSDLAFIGRLKRNHSQFVVLDLIGKHSLSGSIKKTLQEDIERFRMYCNAAIEFKKTEMNNNLNLSFCIVPHALKLCIKHRTIIFLKVAIHSIANAY